MKPVVPEFRSIKIPRDLLTRIKVRAAAQGVPMYKVVESAMERAFGSKMTLAIEKTR